VLPQEPRRDLDSGVPTHLHEETSGTKQSKERELIALLECIVDRVQNAEREENLHCSSSEEINLQ
jgi:hypothetical protein